jgi:hypothetical protein
MKQWIGGATFGPDAVKAMGEAFDQAWAEIAQNFGASVVEVEAARLRLAEAVLSVAAEDNTDVAALKNGALHLLFMDYRSRIRSAA